MTDNPPEVARYNRIVDIEATATSKHSRTAEYLQADNWFKDLVPNFRSLFKDELPQGYGTGTAFTSVSHPVPRLPQLSDFSILSRVSSHTSESYPHKQTTQANKRHLTGLHRHCSLPPLPQIPLPGLRRALQTLRLHPHLHCLLLSPHLPESRHCSKLHRPIRPDPRRRRRHLHGPRPRTNRPRTQRGRRYV